MKNLNLLIYWISFETSQNIAYSLMIHFFVVSNLLPKYVQSYFFKVEDNDDF